MLDKFPSATFTNPGIAVAEFLETICRSAPAVCESPFLLPHDPPIPLRLFAERLHQYFACSDSVFIVAGAYLGRLQDKNPELFHERSAHKLLLSALLVATKFTEDFVYRQKHYAQCGGIEVEEMNYLESTFINLIGFRAFVSDVEFSIAQTCIARVCHMNGLAFQRSKRGPQVTVHGSF